MLSVQLPKVLNGSLPICHHLPQFIPCALEFLQLECHSSISIGQQIFQFCSFLPESIEESLIVCSLGLDIECMQTCESLLHVEEFLFIEALPFVDLFLQQFDLQGEFISFPGVLLQGFLELFLQVGYFCVFDFDDCAERVQLCVESLVLLSHVFLELSQLCVEQPLKFGSQLLHFLIFLLNHGKEVLSSLSHHSLQSLNLCLLLFPSSFLLFKRRRIRSRSFLKLLVESCQLELILFFSLYEIAFNAGHFGLHSQRSLFLCLGTCEQGSFFCLICSISPQCCLCQQSLIVLCPVLRAFLFLCDGKYLLFIPGPQIDDFAFSASSLIISLSLLAQKHIVFNLEVFSASQSKSCPIQLISHSYHILLKSLSLSSIEVCIRGRGRESDGIGRMRGAGGRGVYFKLSHQFN